MEENYGEDQRTVWCGNLSDKVTEDIIYELFLQAAPLEKVRIPKDKDGKQSSYGFITFKHFISVQYAIDLLNGTSLYDRRLNIKPRANNLQRQNSQQNDYAAVGMQKQSNQQISMFDAIQNLNMLMQMGDNLLINNKVYHNNYNQNNMHSSSPYRRPENKNYYDDRHEDNRSNYRKHHHHRNNDRRNTNHRSYHGSRRYDR
ncbi:hypothetical protein ILUMI_09837 [Ignelater luminosus]|uniref:RRM domain-containing protein n=1 Tax=Ignelater luminosus TaxID=2038154 RepID=A0A8K0CZ00_IGNLU|nr:hypothetical protein ILUMI_09837 [Ignelater luminosus]